LRHAFGDDGHASCRVEPVQHAPAAIPDGDDCIGFACNLDRDRRNVLPTNLESAYHAVGLVRPFDGEGCHCLWPCAALVAQAQNGMAHSPIDEVKKAIRMMIPQV
jgi:hypothetical protein